MIGPHIIGGVNRHLSLLARWLPRLTTVLDPNPDEMRDLRAVLGPGRFIVGRIYRPDSEIAGRIRANPEQAAQWAHAITLDRMSPAVNYWQFANEVLQDWEGIALLQRFELERMRLADSAGYKCAIFAFSVGNPDMPDKPNDPAGFDGRMLYWQRIDDALAYAESNGHVVALHQYGAPSLWEPDEDWYIHRLEHQVIPRLNQMNFTRLQFAVTEFGVDDMLRTGIPAGWQTVTPAATYSMDLINIGQYLERYGDRVLGYSVFTLGHNPPWGTYDIAGEVVDRLAAHYEQFPQPLPGTQPPTPPPVQPEPPVVVTGSTGGLEPYWDARLDQRDVEMAPAIVLAGEEYYELVQAYWLDEQESQGRHHVYVDVVDEAGQRMVGVSVRFWWQDGEEIKRTEAKPGESHAVDFPMHATTGAYSVMPDDLPGDIVSGLGMGSIEQPRYTIHTSYRFVFQRQTAGDGDDTGDGNIFIPGVGTGPTEPVVPTPPAPAGNANIIEPLVAQAILNVESGGAAFGPDGRLLIRFEAHIFERHLNNPILFARHFRHAADKPWEEQEWRRDEAETWQPVHTGRQEDEWQAFVFAAELGANAAMNSISMGRPQIMGFNHAVIGYARAGDMFVAFQKSESMQVVGFINFLLANNLLSAMQTKDWETIARKYNGAGNVPTYSALLRNEYERLAGVSR